MDRFKTNEEITENLNNSIERVFNVATDSLNGLNYTIDSLDNAIIGLKMNNDIKKLSAVNHIYKLLTYSTETYNIDADSKKELIEVLEEYIKKYHVLNEKITEIKEYI